MAKKRTALELGEAVRQARQGAGLILEELAKRIDTGISVISQYELGQSNAPAWRLHRIAKATGYTFTVDGDGWHVSKSKKTSRRGRSATRSTPRRPRPSARGQSFRSGPSRRSRQ